MTPKMKNYETPNIVAKPATAEQIQRQAASNIPEVRRGKSLREHMLFGDKQASICSNLPHTISKTYVRTHNCAANLPLTLSLTLPHTQTLSIHSFIHLSHS